MSEWCQEIVSIHVLAPTLLWSLSYFSQKTLGWLKGLTIFEDTRGLWTAMPAPFKEKETGQINQHFYVEKML